MQENSWFNKTWDYIFLGSCLFLWIKLLFFDANLNLRSHRAIHIFAVIGFVIGIFISLSLTPKAKWIDHFTISVYLPLIIYIFVSWRAKSRSKHKLKTERLLNQILLNPNPSRDSWEEEVFWFPPLIGPILYALRIPIAWACLLLSMYYFFLAKEIEHSEKLLGSLSLLAYGSIILLREYAPSMLAARRRRKILRDLSMFELALLNNTLNEKEIIYLLKHLGPEGLRMHIFQLVCCQQIGGSFRQKAKKKP